MAPQSHYFNISSQELLRELLGYNDSSHYAKLCFGKHYVLRTNWAKIHNRCDYAVIYLGDMCTVHMFIIFSLFLIAHWKCYLIKMEVSVSL